MLIMLICDYLGFGRVGLLQVKISCKEWLAFRFSQCLFQFTRVCDTKKFGDSLVEEQTCLRAEDFCVATDVDLSQTWNFRP